MWEQLKNSKALKWLVFVVMLVVLLLTVCIFVFNEPEKLATCTISIKEDLQPTAPLLLRSTFDVTHSTNDAYYLPKNLYGDIKFIQDYNINLSCPNGKVIQNGTDTGETIVSIRYSGTNKNFEVVGTEKTVTLSQFTCSKPGHIARYTGKTCLDGFKEIGIGFQVSSSIFLREITVCFDPIEQITAYSTYSLTRFIRGSQTFESPRPYFEPGEFYNVGNQQVNELYKQKVQRININKQLGLSEDSTKYITENNRHFLSRGHLTANADFVYENQQKATFFFVNAAPQWQTFNGGNWKLLEERVRYFVGVRNVDLVVYTGTHGVMTLPHETSGEPTPIYLYNENDVQAIPVPKMYWKVLYDPYTRAGVAFVGLNNPYNNDIKEEVLCTDICDKLTFSISWSRTNNEMGYGYCCEVKDLRAKIKNIPNIPVNSLLV